MAGIVLFVKLWKKQFWHIPVYVIEFVMKFTVICFENHIKFLLNVAKRIPVNGLDSAVLRHTISIGNSNLTSQLSVRT